MRKKLLTALLSATLIVASLTGCGNKGNDSADTTEKANQTEAASQTETEAPAELENVKLTVWGSEEDQSMLQTMIEGFKEAYADKAVFDISLGVESESTAKDTVLTDIESAADVFAFADDQLNELVSAGALQPISINTDAVIEACGGAESGSVQAATADGTLYAYPMTADNGYFMFYNKEYFSETDVQSFDKMMEVAANAGKKVTMKMDDGWYLYSFFKGAGLNLGLAEDGVNNVCDWNATDGKYSGVDVTEALLNIAKNPGFVSLADEAFVTGVQDGSIIAGVNGTWNATVAKETWGENYAATKLPTYTLAGDQVQMSSFAGYKLIGVNAYSDNAGYAMLLGEWLTNYDNQVLRFETRGLGPANVEAAASESVQSDPAIAALAQQSQYATVQRVGGNYWSPAETFGAIIVAGNEKGTDLQKLVDNMVEGIVAPIQ
ncbi:extracellular solute-binding protein [Anaeromicropila populeti]|uniref:Arabinogalactan oligomer / maltooligosaccharide transport system substrate-binding protein n=1 Tax=Anaeromicropila populeti TaxID=37658 RepID=A0A1I6JRD7_9FIRM|nr:extracellular solute-binding protein [Anaeromicropila populeti]SFR81543.1 arabinogalactan oligomer / maltooligosaccharide transport system substrate-binding protein [Anaeromicropila populeti]